MEIKSVRGMNDLFGEELERWQLVEKKIFRIFSDFGFSEIRTPVLEKIEVFSRTVGDTSDIVEKQMYTLTDLSKDTLVLRPEGTAAFMRAVVEHQIHQYAGPQRFFYYLPMFRHERPQKGRLRQFHQFGAELIQDNSPEADAEILSLVDTLFREIGISDFRTRLNSVGCAQCRPLYRVKLVESLKKNASSLCETCQQRIERAPLRVLDCKNESCKKIAESAPKMIDHLCTACSGHHTRLKECLDQLKVPFDEDTSIVRGLDYYTRTAFEITSDQLGAQDALGGGGRYDGLSEQFGKPNLGGIGFASGMERTMLALEAAGKLPAIIPRPSVYLAPLGEKAFNLLFPLNLEMKKQGIRTEMSYDRNKGLKNLLKHADRRGHNYVVVVGDDEIAKSEALVKEMKTGIQTTIKLGEILLYVEKRTSGT